MYSVEELIFHVTVTFDLNYDIHIRTPDVNGHDMH